MKKKILNMLFKIYCIMRYQRLDNNLTRHIRLKYGILRAKKCKLSKKSVNLAYDKNNNGKTIFILGSGESLSQLTDAQWSEISKHTVLGVNMSIIHDYPVDIHFWEPLESKALNLMFLERFEDVKFKNTQLIFSELYSSRNNVRDYLLPRHENILEASYGYFPIELTMEKPTVELFESLIHKCDQPDKVLHHCTQIGAATDYCYKAGYSNIVLIGCDLNGGKYFTEIESASEMYRDTGYYSKFNSERISTAKKIKIYYGDEHPTMKKEHTESRGRLTAIDYFRTVSKRYKKTGCNLMVVNKESALSDFVEVYEFNESKT